MVQFLFCMTFYNLLFLGIDTKAPIMEKRVSSVKDIWNLFWFIIKYRGANSVPGWTALW